MAAVTLTKVPVEGYGDESRYDVLFLGTKIGQVYKYTERVDTNTGPSRIGNFVNRTYWHYEAPAPHRPHYLGYHTRYDAIAGLLEVNHYPGRPHIAARLARAARPERSKA